MTLPPEILTVKRGETKLTFIFNQSPVDGSGDGRLLFIFRDLLVTLYNLEKFYFCLVFLMSLVQFRFRRTKPSRTLTNVTQQG